MLDVEHIRNTTPAGSLLNRILELEYDTKNLSVSWKDITSEEVLGLRILEQERQKHMNELREDAEERMAMQQKVNRQASR